MTNTETTMTAITGRAAIYRYATVDCTGSPDLSAGTVTGILGRYAPGSREVDAVIRRESSLPRAVVVCLDETDADPIGVGDEVDVDADGVATRAPSTCSDCEGSGHVVGSDDECACDEGAGETCCARCGGSGEI